MEGLDMMDWMLEEAKKAPMEIHHDFDTRFRVWVDQIIPSRIDAIRACGGDMEYVIRMTKLTVEDATRLQKRALYEFWEEEYMDVYAIRIEQVLKVLTEATNAYLNEVKQ